MSTFVVTSDNQVIDSVNYLLSNLGQVGNVGNVTIPTGTLIGNTTTGIVSTFNAGGGDAYSYLYQYLNLRYANNATGTSGFSTVPTNSDYFGVYNSITSAASSVPAAYTWFQVAGGFGATKTIFYSTQGGRQVQLVPANVAPSSSFIQSTANVAIDLDVVTTAAGTPGSRGPIAMAYVVTPGTPVGASDLQLTAWWEAARDSLTPPIGTGLTPVTGDTGTFIYGAGVGTPSETYEFNGSGWNEVVPQVISGNVIVGNSLPGNAITVGTVTGNRVAANTITGNTIQVSTITGNLIAASTITGNLIAANTITGNTIQASTITGNLIAANTITATNIQTNTITANQIAAGTITATQISADYLYTGNIISTGATLGSNTSTGYWLRHSDGAARFGGNVSIGNSAAIGSNVTIGGNLTVGDNAIIGSNLSVVGLVTAGSLISNSVSTNTVVTSAITNQIANSSITIQTISTPSGGTYYPVNTTANITPSFSNQVMNIFAGCIIEFSLINLSNNSYTAVILARLIRTDITGVATILSEQQFFQIVSAGGASFQPFPQIYYNAIWPGYADTLPNTTSYRYSISVRAVVSGPSVTADSLSFRDRNIFVQSLKR